MESYHGLIEKRGTKDNYTKAYSFPAVSAVCIITSQSVNYQSHQTFECTECSDQFLSSPLPLLLTIFKRH